MRWTTSLTWCLLTAPAAYGQATPPLSPTVTLSITERGTEIGREDVTVRDNRRGGPGTTIVTTARYPAPRPRVQLSAEIERDPAGAFATAQLDRESPEHAWRTYAAVNGPRLTIRSATEGRETAREQAAVRGLVVLDDSLYGPWLAVAGLADARGAALTAVFPRTGRRARIVARRSGSTVAVTGDVTATIELSADGTLRRVALPGRGVEATVLER